MTIALLAGTLGLMSLPGLTRRFSWRLPPDEWVRLSAVSVVGGAVLLEAALIECATPALARLPLVGWFFGSHHPHHLFPGGSPAGWLALALAVAVPAGAIAGLLRAHRQQRAARVEAWLGEHHAQDGFELVVLPTDGKLAVAVPGKPRQVVVSAGVIGALTPRQLRVVLDHEAAHLRFHHSRYLLAAAAVEGAFWFIPTLRRSLGALRLGMEYSADRAACTTARDRAAIRSALLALTGTGTGVSVPAFGKLESLEARLRALDVRARPSIRHRIAVYAATAGLLAASVVPLTTWLRAG